MTTVGHPPTSIRVLQITDFHLLADPTARMLGVNTNDSFRAVLDRVAEFDFQPDLFLLTGDLVQDAEAATYQRLQGFLRELSAPVYCLAGNHDDPQLMTDHLADGERIFFQPRISLNGWDIVCLDSTLRNDPCGYLSDAQLALLDEQLAAIASDSFVAVAMHHPPIPVGSRWLDTMMVRNAQDLWERLDQYPNVRAVVTGHVHQTVDEIANGRRVLSSPSTCFQFKPSSADFAVEAAPQGFQWLMLGSDGSIQNGVERVSRIPVGLDLASIGY